MKQRIWKRLLSFMLTFAMIFSACTWNLGGDAIKAEATETAVTLSNPRKDSNGNVTYDCVWFGSYPQSDATGEKKDAIKWRVLSVDGNDAFLIADCNLDYQQYNTTYESVTWEMSTIRSWLNGYNASYNANGIDYSSGNFIDKAFTGAEKDAINQVTVVNNDNPNYGIEGGNDTKDKVFLLSMEEVTNLDYGFLPDKNEEDEARGRIDSAYAKAQNPHTVYNEPDFWWLRSPDYVQSGAFVASKAKSILFVNDNYNAVCPALHLNLSLDVGSYAGTVCTDGKVDESGAGKPIVTPEDIEPENPVTPTTLSNPRKDSNGNVTYDCVWFGRYPQSDATGKKKEAIKWRVLSVDGNDAFLIADCNLDYQQYNTTYESVTWEMSTIRSWLNGYNASYNANGIDYSSGNFIDKAFTGAEKDAINQVTVVNNDNPDDGTEGGNDTNDKVFLLSIEEVTNPDYGFLSDKEDNDNARCRINTAYAEAQNPYTEYSWPNCWWLRSPYAYGAACVDDSGYANIIGRIDYDGDAVCPALHLNLSSASAWHCAGTVCTDGTVDEIKPPVSTEENNTGNNTGNTTQKPGEQSQNKVPAKKGTVLTANDTKLKFKVTSSDASNPTVSVIGATSKNRTAVTIPATVTISGVTYKVTAISTKAFNGYKKLKTVTIGSNVKKIGSKAFYGCTALTKATIGKNVTSIGTKAFCRCKKLKSIKIPSKVKTIGSCAFYGCTALTKVTIGKSVTSIGTKAFCKCTKLASVTIPSKVKTIGNNAFYGCKKLKKVTMTAGKLKSVGKGAFKGVSKKMTITLKGTKKAKTTLKKKLKKASVGYVKTWKIK